MTSQPQMRRFRRDSLSLPQSEQHVALGQLPRPQSEQAMPSCSSSSISM